MSYRQSGPFDEIRNNLMRSGAPFSGAIIGINVVLFLIDAFTKGLPLFFTSCNVDNGMIFHLWGPVTYPLLTADFINMVFGCFWMWFVGGSLERAWGLIRFATYFFAISIVTALSLDLGSKLLHEEHTLSGLWLPLTSLTCAWAAINPREVLRMYGVFNIEARWLALFMVGVVFFEEFKYDVGLGFFALVAPILSYYYVRGNWGVGIGGTRAYRSGPDLRMSSASGYRITGLDGSRRPTGLAGWWQDIQERRRLRKLLKDSRYNDRDFRDR